MEKLDFSQVGEQMYHEKLENGLNVFVFPKPGFQKGYAFFATNYDCIRYIYNIKIIRSRS